MSLSPTKLLIPAMTLSLLATACAPGEISDSPVDDTPDPLAAIVQSRYIVVLDDEMPGMSAQSIASRFGVDPSAQFQSALDGFVFSGSPADAEALAFMPGVKHVEPDWIVYAVLPNDADTPSWCAFVPSHPQCEAYEPPPEEDTPEEGSELPSYCRLIPTHPNCSDGTDPDPDPEPDPEPDPAPNPGNQVTPWGVERVGGTGGYGNHTAWVVDTGIDLLNQDLNVDRDRSKSFLDFDFSAGDLQGHGTHVAGTIGALDNGQGVLGVAPGVPLVSLRVLDAQGRGTISSIIKAVDHISANAKAGDVVNMSVGGSGFSDVLDQAIKKAAAKGIFFSIAAGNETKNAEDFAPASTNATNVFTVSAIGEDDCLASFSNYGEPVDIAAPGVGVVSTKLNGGVVSLSGTSMAAPHVAGLLLQNGSLSSDGPICGDRDAKTDQVAHR